MPGQAPSILGAPNHARKAGAKIDLVIRASCSAAPASAGARSASARSATGGSGSGGSSAAASASARSATAASHARIGRRRRQRQAKSQDSTGERASQSALLFTMKLRKGMHCRDPSCRDELPKKHIRDEIIRLRLSHDYALRLPRDLGATKIEMNIVASAVESSADSLKTRVCGEWVGGAGDAYRRRTGCVSRACQPTRSSSGMRCSSRGKPTQR
jgi:hypothetical protein